MIHETSFQLQVRGITWGGFDADYTYNLSRKEPETLTMQDAKNIAGDFQSLSEARVIRRDLIVKEEIVKVLA